MSEYIGRAGDMQMLQERLRSATSQQERDLIKSKMDFIHREARDPEITELRKDLVMAARNGDNEAGDKISEQIYLAQKRKGIK